MTATRLREPLQAMFINYGNISTYSHTCVHTLICLHMNVCPSVRSTDCPYQTANKNNVCLRAIVTSSRKIQQLQSILRLVQAYLIDSKCYLFK